MAPSINPVSLHDRDQIEAHFRQNIYLHLYELGDLDDFFWQYTVWFGWHDSGALRGLALLYTGGGLPVLIGLHDDPNTLRALIRSLLPYLPRNMHAHLSQGATEILAEDYEIESHGSHLKMALTRPERLKTVDTSLVTRVGVADLAALSALYASSYPGNWFDPRMLETGQYFAVRDRSNSAAFVSVAGIHVYSPRYRVAALGNITTHPAFRGKGYGAAATARLCTSLLETVDHVGLNVKADNRPAIAVYERIGFTPIAQYHEYSLTLKGQ
jgi:ribosomal protein S18 acetylase RimI-like enzyme